MVWYIRYFVFGRLVRGTRSSYQDTPKPAMAGVAQIAQLLQLAQLASFFALLSLAATESLLFKASY